MFVEVICGSEKAVDGRSDLLVCNLEPDHELPHGVRIKPGMPPYVRWPVAYVESDTDRTRDQWSKPHVRRKYQTLAMWKAGR